MIQKPNRLAYILGYQPNDINNIIQEIDKYYYEKKSEKIKNGLIISADLKS